jgi:hypothetical protein
MRGNAWTGVKTLFGLGPPINHSVDEKPDGHLLHENFITSLIPLHAGMRQYRRDFDALELSHALRHREWWRDFLRSSRGTGFWHETYFMRGGLEAAYNDIPVRLRFGQFAPMHPTRGPMFSARTRAKLSGTPTPAVVEEAELCGLKSSSQAACAGAVVDADKDRTPNFSFRALLRCRRFRY